MRQLVAVPRRSESGYNEPAGAVARPTEGDIQTLRTGAAGDAVAELHQALIELGISVPANEAATEKFGVGTEAAVRDFQAKWHLTVDGVFGPQTWAALQGEDGPDGEPAGVAAFATDGLSEAVARLLDVADQEYRRPVLEDPFGSNRGPRVDLYLVGHRQDGVWLRDYQKLPSGQYRGAPWCGRFALWCVEEAAQQIGAMAITCDWGDLASARKWLTAAQSADRTRTTPSAGDVGCILTGGHGHVVLVARVLEDGRIVTREGNSANRVAARVREAAEFSGFVSLAP